jgi:Dyp-type peroxidase family
MTDHSKQLIMVSVGMVKNKELFLFFNITDVASFKTHLAGDLHPLLTSATQALSSSTPANPIINIAFSQKGLDVLGIADSLGDTIFTNGQAADASNLGDPGATGTEGWQPEFKAGMHGIILFASNDVSSVTDGASNVLSIFGDSITEVYRLLGEARPDSEEGHERRSNPNLASPFSQWSSDFGFKDGIGQPAINGFNDLQIFPGQTAIDPGHILLGETGDATTRPDWAKDGSFLVFRQLKQLVPEFNKYLLDNALTTANGQNLTQQEGADLLGARIVGRWKSVSCFFTVIYPVD